MTEMPLDVLEDVICGAGSEWTCPGCGYLVDTPQHIYGCQQEAE